ncbi:LCP family protein [Streptomyces sp. NPDC057743]|uniref:LCP family protein n=1 Tax=Streptomyces sp. NPDC057743 TaxID=3346236 RepID=UPI0036C4027E
MGKSRHRKPSSRRRGWRITLWAAASLVVLGGSTLGFVYYKLTSNLQSVDINAALGDRPANVDNGSMDILVVGSDSRAGSNSKYGKDVGGARSDTAMLLHLYAGHKQASVVSIPRDTMVPRPECKTPDGKTSPAVQRAQFNDAYSVGGAICTVKTVEAMTGIRMDHYLEVDFVGFQRLIDKLGGVEVTTTKPIKDRWSHLHLSAGKHKLNGEQALGLVRTRHGVGDGSDLGRIKLQQAFIKALIEQVKSVGLFTNPAKLYGLADTATKALVTDSDLASVDKLLSFANGLKDIGSQDIHMVTLPVGTDLKDKNRVMPLDSAKQLWQALHDDKPIPEATFKNGDGANTQADSVIR